MNVSNKFVSVLVVVFAAFLSGCGGDVQEVSTMPTIVNAGVFTLEAPSGWALLSGAKEKSARREIEASTQQMISEYSSNSGGDKGGLGLEAFKAVRMPKDAGWLMVYTMRIPPEANYLATMEKDQAEKISWGMNKGLVTRIHGQGRKTINGKEVLWIDLEMRGDARTIAIYYWAEADPGLVGTISATVNPGTYSNVEQELDGIWNSLQIQGAL